MQPVGKEKITIGYKVMEIRNELTTAGHGTNV